MLGDLSPDIIGTNPQYPSIVNHDWLNPTPADYDNFPSDNNPVRVLPKLSDLWRMNDVGFSIIPNQAVTLQGGKLSAGVKAEDVQAVSREARKAIMAGLVGKALANHLRGIFNADQIKAASNELAVIANEVGLLGNVYIDARAFTNYNEADNFLLKHRNKLARDMLYDDKQMNGTVVAFLASKFRKSAVTEIKYDDEMLDHYRKHLIMAGRIPSNYPITNKEDLRQAFLHIDPKPQMQVQAKAFEPMSEAEISANLKELAERNAQIVQEGIEASLLKKIKPVIALTQEYLAKGVIGDGLKRVLRSKFSSEDIASASPYIRLELQGLEEQKLNQMVDAGSLSKLMCAELKKIAKQFPVKKQAVSRVEPSQVTPSFVPTGEALLKKPVMALDGLKQKACDALARGINPELLMETLQKKLSADRAGEVVTAAIALLNKRGAGVQANKAVKSFTKKVVADPNPKKTLPDPSTIIPQTQEILSFFEGSQMDEIEINPAS